MRVCSDCDQNLKDDDLFCSRCGTAAGGQDRTVAIAARQEPESALVGSALGSFEAELRGNTSDAGRLALAAFERLLEGEVDDALLAAESAVTMDPQLWSAHLIAGVARNQRGETEQAEAHLQDALIQEPKAVHYKAALERLMAGSTKKKRIAVAVPAGAKLPAFSPAIWAAMAAITVLVIGLMWAISGSRKNEFRRERPDFTASRPSVTPTAPINQPYPMPAPRSQAFPAPSYVPPTPSIPSLSGTRPSAPPPINYDERPDTTGGSASRPGALPSASAPSDFEPLPPAQPDVSGLKVQPSGESGQAAQQTPRTNGVSPSNPTPWTQQNTNRNPSGGTSFLGGKPTGNARLGSEPANQRPNIPLPSDAVTSTDRVRPAPAAPAPERPRIAAPVPPPAPEPTGRVYQAQARRLQNQGQWAEAAQMYRQAISAYEEEINSGRNPRSAEYGIAASKAALDLLENSR